MPEVRYHPGQSSAIRLLYCAQEVLSVFCRSRNRMGKSMGKPWRTTHTLKFGDCDVSGIAYFPAYLNMLNGVNEEFWADLGYPWHEVIRIERWATPTVHLTADFSTPSFHGDELTFEVSIKKVGRTSVTLSHRITCNDELRWSATQVLVASELDRHKSIPWPEAVRIKLQAATFEN